MLLHRRSGHYSQAVTDIDRHMHWHATNAGSRLRKREEGRTQYQRLFTVATITAHPFPHRRTHPHSPTRQMHLPTKIRPERGRTLSQRYQWRTYVSKHARKHAHTHTHTHELMSCQSPLVFIVFISCWIACLFKQSILRDTAVVQKSHGAPRGPTLPFLYRTRVFRMSRT